MNEGRLRERTRAFALETIRLVDGMPKTEVGRVLGRQLLRAGTSVGANYRAACRARSRREMRARLAVVEEEADECAYWLELLADTGLLAGEQLAPLQREAHEIVAMTVASIKTLRAKPLTS